MRSNYEVLSRTVIHELDFFLTNLTEFQTRFAFISATRFRPGFLKKCNHIQSHLIVKRPKQR